MAQNAVVTINDTTPTLLFDGDGLVAFGPGGAINANTLIGGAGLTQANGLPMSAAAFGVPMRVLSGDQIYGLRVTASGSVDIHVFSCR